MVQEASKQEYYYGTGKRKTSIAKVKLYPAGEGPMQVNGRLMEEYFPWLAWQAAVMQPFQVTQTVGKFRALVSVAGGGVHSQAEAVRHGIARALVVFDENLKPTLRRYHLMTRDSRIKESKKYGLKRARRAPQYTKR